MELSTILIAGGGVAAVVLISLLCRRLDSKIHGNSTADADKKQNGSDEKK